CSICGGEQEPCNNIHGNGECQDPDEGDDDASSILFWKLILFSKEDQNLSVSNPENSGENDGNDP
ncbi:MAG: hypothetical protein ACJAYM_002266, partial [Flavobacteriales bacterium]